MNYFFHAFIENVAQGFWCFFTHICFINSGKGRGSEDHCLQKRPQQGVRLKNEVIPDVVQRHREALRYNAFHSQVYIFFTFFFMWR